MSRLFHAEVKPALCGGHDLGIVQLDIFFKETSSDLDLEIMSQVLSSLSLGRV